VRAALQASHSLHLVDKGKKEASSAVSKKDKKTERYGDQLKRVSRCAELFAQSLAARLTKSASSCGFV